METTLILTILILILIAILFVVVYLNQKTISKAKAKQILTKLNDLQMDIMSNESSVRRDAVIKLDNLLAKSLQYYYNNSLPCGDNLKKAKNIFKKKEYNDIWEVHKIRNNIVHNDYDIPQEEARKVYNTYKLSIIKIIK
ncbi:MAG TPA: hypothetical protein PLS56_00650 [Candidatus Dojkabacteria bacterium]|nr:hypothetical protein [Candidatus Dojkabacteria bacterium]